MAEVRAKISINDKFSKALERFCSLLDLSAEKLDGLENKIKQSITVFDAIDLVTDKWHTAKQALEDYASTSQVKLLEDEKRLKAIYGDKAGGGATQMYKNAAMSLGRGTQEYMQNAVSMTTMGMSTGQTNDWLKMADRIATITGEEFSSVASSMKSSIEGASVGSLAQSLGGGAGTEKMLERAGVGRMLARGNLEGALAAYQKIADKLGYSAEAAEKMNNTVSNKLLKTMTKIDNIILDIKTSFANAIEPIVLSVLDAINKFLNTKLVQNTLKFIKISMEWIKVAADQIASGIEFVSDKFAELADFMSPAIYGIGALIAGQTALKLGVLGLVKVAGWGIRFVSAGLNMLMRHPILTFASIIISGLTIAAQYFGDWYEEQTGKGLNFVEKLTSMWFYLVGGLYQSIENVGIWFSNLWEGIKASFSRTVVFIWNKFNEVLTDLRTDFFKSIFSLFDAVLDKVQKVLEALGEVSETAKQAASKVGQMRGSFADSELTNRHRKTLGNIQAYQGNYKDYGSVHDNAMKFAELGNGLGKQITKFFKPFVEKTDEALSGINKDTHKIRGKLTEEQEVAWLKELSERQYINKFNVQSPQNTLNLSVTNNKPTDMRDMEQQLKDIMEREMNSGGFGTGITINAQGA